MHQLLYLADNKFVPTYRVTSTARLGQKWNHQVDIGDLVDLTITETNESFGKAVIVGKELLNYNEVLENADHNHVAFSDKVDGCHTAAGVLNDELRAAYGNEFSSSAVFTVLHILRLNEDVVEAKAGNSTTPNPLDYLAEIADQGVAAMEITEYAEVGELQSERTVRFEF